MTMAQRPNQNQLNVLPMAMAYCYGNRVLRPFLSRKPTYLAILVVTIPDMAGYFETAVEVLLRGRMSFGVRSADDQFTVKRIVSGRTSRDQIIGAAQSGDKHVVLIFSNEIDVPPEYRSMADVYDVVSKFDASVIAGAVFRVCNTRVSAEEAEYLLGLPMDRLTAAFRRGRPTHRALTLLRRTGLGNSARSGLGGSRDEVPFGIEELIGYGDAKTWSLDLLKDLKLFKAGRMPWRDVDPGLLLSGPTGTGKTRFASALAHSADLPLFHASAARWQAAGHLGDLLREMRRSFAEAVESSPSILLIDEIDSIGDRTQLRGESSDYTRQVINGLLECMDGALSRPGVVLIGTTNFPDHVDSALLRPGRLDRHIRIGLPTAVERVGILSQYLNLHIDGDIGDQISELTDDWSGAQMSQLARLARRHAREAQRGVISQDIISVMPETVQLTEEQLSRIAVHECGHAIIGLALRKEITAIRILDRYPKDAESVSLGSVSFRRTDERRNLSHYLNEICVLMAGVAAEWEVIGDHSDGAGGHEDADLVVATRLATRVEGALGMGRTLISEAGTEDQFAVLRLRDGDLWSRVDRLLNEQMERAREIIRANRAALDDLSNAITNRKKMTGVQLTEFVNARGYKIEQRPAVNPRATQEAVR